MSVPATKTTPSSLTEPTALPLITAASLVPRMFTVTEVRVPSAEATENVSV